MPISNLVRRVFATTVQRSTGHRSAVNVLREWMRGVDLLNKSTGKLPKGQEYSASVWVFRCVNVWMQLANVPLQLVRRNDGERDVVDTSPLAFLLKSPSSKMGQRAFIEKALGSMAMHGAALITREDGENFTGIPKYLGFLPPDRTRVDERDTDAEGNVLRYTVRRKDGREYKVDARGVIVISLPMSVSPISAARASMDADYASRQHNAHMMANHGRIGGIVSFDDPNIDESRLRDYGKLWNETYSGPENAGKTAFMSKADYQAINQSAKDMDWLNGQYVSREEIFAAFNVPPIIAGDFRYGTYANYEQAAKELWVTCLMPLGGRIIDALQRTIVDGNERSAQLEFDYANHVPALRPDTASKIAQYAQLIREGFVSPKRAAEIVGLDIGETNALHETVWTTFNLIPAVDSLQSDAVYTNPDGNPSLDPDDPPPPPKEEPKNAEGKAIGSDAREVMRTLKWRALMNIRVPYERKMADVMKRYFFDQRSTFLRNLDAYVGKIKSGAPGVVTKGWKADDLIGSIIGDKVAWDKRIVSDTDPVTESAIEASARDTLRELGKPNQYSRLALSRYRETRPIIMAKVNDTTYGRLLDSAKSLEQSISGGMTVDDAAEKMAQSIRSELAASEARRRIIARTEMGRAFESAREEQMKEAGVEKIEWLSSRDSEVRDSHSRIDGDVITIGERFDNGLHYPMDPEGDPGETINCRCTSLAVLD